MKGRLVLSAFFLFIVSQHTPAIDLIEVYQLAEQNDPIYRQAIFNTKATTEEKSQVRALLLPAINMSANTFDNAQTNSGSSFGASGETDFNSHGYVLTMEQPLFRWERYLALKQADSVILQAEAEQYAIQQALIIRVAEHYFGLLSAVDNLEFSRTEARSLSQQFDQANQRFAVGLTAITDIQEAQAGLDRAHASEILAQNLLDNAKENLREITGEYLPELDSVRHDMPLISPKPNDINQWARQAQLHNCAIIIAKHKLDSAQQEIKRQHAGHLPTLDLIANHGFQTFGGRFGETKTRSTSVGLEFNVPLYQGGLVNAKTKVATHRYHESLQQLEQALRAAQREARQTYLGVMSGISRITALQQAVTSSETALKATEAGFEVGTRTAVDVVAAERNTLNAKRNYSRARYDYLLDSLRLKKATGVLNADDLKQMSLWLD